MRCLFEALNGVAGASREKRRDLELVRDAAWRQRNYVRQPTTQQQPHVILPAPIHPLGGQSSTL